MPVIDVRERLRRVRASKLVVMLALTVTSCGGQSPSAPSPPPVPTLTALELEALAIGGRPLRGRVVLSSAAPQPGVAVMLTSSDAAVTVPATVTVSAGSTSADFDVATIPVTRTTEVTIAAEAAGVSRSIVVRVRADPASVRPSATVSIGFAGLRTAPGPVSGYEEGGFTITPQKPEWVTVTTYGNPSPYIQFLTPAGTTTVGELRITAGGEYFWFTSMEVYSSTTPIPYEVNGFIGTDLVFTASGMVGNTFGRFAPVTNPRLDTPVDALVITLSNPAAPCCGNPMGLDNLVLRR